MSAENVKVTKTTTTTTTVVEVVETIVCGKPVAGADPDPDPAPAPVESDEDYEFVDDSEFVDCQMGPFCNFGRHHAGSHM